MINAKNVNKKLHRLFSFPKENDETYKGSLLYYFFNIPTNIEEAIDKSQKTSKQLELIYDINISDTKRRDKFEETYILTCFVNSSLKILGFEEYKKKLTIFGKYTILDKRKDTDIIMKKHILGIANDAKNKDVHVFLNDEPIDTELLEADINLYEKTIELSLSGGYT